MKLLVLLLLVIPAASFGQPTYQANIRVEDRIWRDGGQEWVSQMYVDLYINGMLVSPSSSYYYEWYANRDGQWIPWLGGSGNGLHHIPGDGEVGWPGLTCVVISGSGFSTTSEAVPVGKSGQPKEVDIFARRESGAHINASGILVWIDHWMGNNWREKIAKSSDIDPKYYQLTLNDDEILGSRPFAISSIGEKFNNWNNNTAHVVNHSSFGITHTTDHITARYRGIHSGIVLKNEMIDKPSITDGIIQFKDPWLTDMYDSQRDNRLRNQGMSAPFKDITSSPFTINTNFSGSDTEYKGVFKNQFVVDASYYSVRAPLSKLLNDFTWYFQNWTISGGVTLSQVGSNPSGYDQKAAVFTGANATITGRYKAHRASTHNTPTAGIGQRRIAYSSSGNEYLILYESAGEIWSTNNPNNAGWQAEKRVSTGNGSNSKPSVAAISNKQTGVWQRNTGSNNYIYHPFSIP
jgi:hypothetical protein